MSLFAERQLIEIRIPGGKPGKDGSEALQRYCETLSDDVITLIHLPRLDRQQLGSAWFSALDGAGVTVRVDAVERHALPQWIAQRLAAQGQRVQDGDAGAQTLAFFADRVEGNLLAAHQELQKIALLYPPGVLSFEQIEAAVLNVARYDVFKFAEAVLAGQTARVLRMLDGLRAEGEAPVLVHWTLAEDIRALKRVKDAVGRGKPMPVAMREARVWGAKERLYERAGAAAVGPHAGPLARSRQRVRRPDQGTQAPALAARRLGRPEAARADGHAAHRSAQARAAAAAGAAGVVLTSAGARRSSSCAFRLEQRACVSSRARDPRRGQAAARRAAPARWPPPAGAALRGSVSAATCGSTVTRG